MVWKQVNRRALDARCLAMDSVYPVGAGARPGYEEAWSVRWPRCELQRPRLWRATHECIERVTSVREDDRHTEENVEGGKTNPTITTGDMCLLLEALSWFYHPL